MRWLRVFVGLSILLHFAGCVRCVGENRLVDGGENEIGVGAGKSSSERGASGVGEPSGNLTGLDDPPYDFVRDDPVDRPLRGTILLIHGSAPFNIDGRIPMDGLDFPYARETFYLDLAKAFTRRGWATIRYAKPGVEEGRVDPEAYAETDLATLEEQLRALWRIMPAEYPRIVMAWSEGTLHVRALPLGELDGVILLGAISTNIGDVVAWQGGPPKEELARIVAGKDRREMLGVDRPAGRLADELALPDNWWTFLPRPDLPILVLHGKEDKEVPPSQAAHWKEKLEHHALTVVVGDGLDHRFMPAGRYRPESPAKEVLSWLDRTFPE